MNLSLPGAPASFHEFSWETLRSFLDGVSPIDLENLSLHNREEAVEFLASYGYDLTVADELAEAAAVLAEALHYLREVLCPAPTAHDHTLRLPAELDNLSDIPTVLVIASQPRHPLQPWACALLRVMHTISHANHAVRSPFYTQIKTQILDRYRAHLHVDDSAHLWLGQGEDRVLLESCTFREEKSRESLILKLLHKPDNVAQSVYDRIGVRFVTPTRVDALLVLKYLRRHNLAIFANIMPGRSRNTLVDLQLFRNAYHQASRKRKKNQEDVMRLLRDLSFDPVQLVPPAEPNPHSSPNFRSIQFTCRQLIRIKNPVYAAAAKLIDGFDGHPAVDGILEELYGHKEESVLRFFFPYEVQILDLENAERTESGESSHASYRLRQLRTARRRVLGALLARPQT